MPTLTDDNTIRKAAVLIRSLDGEAAAAVLQRLSADDARALRDAVRELGEVGDDERQAVASELLSPLPASGADDESGGVELAISSGSRFRAEPSPQSEPTAAANPQDTRPVDWLGDAEPQALASLLRHEQAQTIAAVLSRLPPSRAAGVLGLLPADQRPVVLDRLADLGDADPETLDVITSGLREWIAQRERRHALRTQRLSAIEAILAATEEGQRSDLLGAVEDRPWRRELSLSDEQTRFDPRENPSEVAGEEEVAPPEEQVAAVQAAEQPEPVAEELPLLVSFADVERFPVAALAQVMRHAPAEHLLLALAGGSKGLTRKITAALPRRQATELRRRLTRIGPTRLRDIELAQHSVARVASELLRRGWVSLAGPLR